MKVSELQEQLSTMDPNAVVCVDLDVGPTGDTQRYEIDCAGSTKEGDVVLDIGGLFRLVLPSSRE